MSFIRGPYYDYLQGLAYARYDTPMFLSINGYIDDASTAALKASIASTEAAIAAATDSVAKETLQAQLNAYNAKLAIVNDPASAASYNAALVQHYQKASLRAFGPQVAAELNGYEISEFDSFAEFYEAVPFRSLTAPGLRAKDVRYMLDPEYKAEIDAQETHENLWHWFGDFIRDDGRTITKENYDKQLDGTDLLLFELGGNDVFSTALYQLIGTGSEISDYLTDYVKMVMDNIPQTLTDIEWVLDYCLEKNPDMTVCLVGIYDYYMQNDISALNLDLTEDATTLLMDAFVTFTAAVNGAMINYANTHDNVYFADTNGVQTISYETQSGDATHPSVEGHDYIARRILAALPDEFTDKEQYDIIVDLLGVYNPLSSKNRVVSVTVDGKIVKNYELNGFKLTIHYSNANANLVTVVVGGEKLSTVTYQVQYSPSDGYRTYQVSKTSDVVSTASLLVSKLQAKVKSVLAGLFKK